MGWGKIAGLLNCRFQYGVIFYYFIISHSVHIPLSSALVVLHQVLAGVQRLQLKTQANNLLARGIFQRAYGWQVPYKVCFFPRIIFYYTSHKYMTHSSRYMFLIVDPFHSYIPILAKSYYGNVERSVSFWSLCLHWYAYSSNC